MDILDYIAIKPIIEDLIFKINHRYKRQPPIRRPKLDAFVSAIDHWLEEDVKVPRKQRHTAKRVFDRLRDECGFTGGYTIIKGYRRSRSCVSMTNR